MNVNTALLAFSLIAIFGFLSEALFRRTNIPDVLFLIILGFIIGPNGFGYTSPEDLASVAPVCTTFTLLILIFDGAFNINLSSLIREFSSSLILTIYNFVISTIVVGGIFYYIHQYHLDGTTMMAAMVIGFSLAGVSSSFVIPILSQIRVGGKLFSRLALESALTDVFCIVATLSVIEVYTTGIFGVQKTLTYLIELFAIAGFIGVLGGIIWIVIRVFEEQNYIITIAYLILVYLATEYFGGNGPIAALFLGLILNNSKQLSSIKEGILSRSVAEKQKAIQGDLGIEVTSASEKRYYNLISFFLKALFFIYVGILLDITDQTALVVGSILSVLIMITRMGSMPLTKGMQKDQRQLVNAVFARGLAAAVLIQAVIQAGMPGAEYMARVVYVVIIGTIILSSMRVYILRMNLAKPKG
ncbi:MAG: cation:proton antiporter [Candidatus Neomarinimicrobiota bacterium]|nr:cation:proton antiporter [Candidatus Neomarinimicrobiota bacterium]